VKEVEPIESWADDCDARLWWDRMVHTLRWPSF